MIVYLITNKVNGKAYVGLTVKSLAWRWKSHCASARFGSEMLIARAIRKYGVDGFIVEQIGLAYSIKEMQQMEQDFIKRYETLSPLGYNLTTGGEHYQLTEDVKRRIGEKQKGEKNHRFGKPNKVNLGRTFSAEVRAKVGAASKGRTHTMSEAGKQRLRERRTGVALSAETRAKISAANKGIKKPYNVERCRELGKRPQSLEQRKKNSDWQKNSLKAQASIHNPERRARHSRFMKALWESRRLRKEGLLTCQ